MGHVMFMRKGDVHTEPILLPIGTVWLFTSNGTFTAPADGKYQVEIHGGGGGAAGHVWGGAQNAVASGGGSGELYETVLSKGEQVSVTVGSGGAAELKDASSSFAAQGGTGGKSTFGNLSCAGGGGGEALSEGVINEYSYSGGLASGSLATRGSGSSAYQVTTLSVSGGQGNKNNTSQTYGDGGAVTNCSPKDGKAGAVIVTYLGKE